MGSKTINIELPDGRGKFYDMLLDKYSGIGHGYKLDTKEKEDIFLNDIGTILSEGIDFKGKLILLDFLIYQVQIEDSDD